MSETLKNNPDSSSENSKWDNLGKEVSFVEKPVEMPSTDDMDKIILSPTDDMGPNRQDRKVTLTVEGEEKRTSNILLGYNKQGFELEDGEYLSAEDFSKAMSEYLSAQPDGTKFVRRVPEKTFGTSEEFVSDMLETVRSGSNTIDVAPAEKPENVDARKVEISEPDSKEKVHGLFMLPKDGEVKLENGEYVSATEISTAIENYFLAVPEEKVIPPVTPPVPPIPPVYPVSPKGVERTPEQIKEPEKHYEVIKRIRDKRLPSFVAPLIISATILLASTMTVLAPGLDKNASATGPEESQIRQEIVIETPTENVEESGIAFDIVTGESIDVPEGVEYHSASDARWNSETRSATFSKEGLRQPGEYNVDYISVLDKEGAIQDVAYEPGVSLPGFIEKASKETGISEDELVAAIHLGGPVSGWVYVDEIPQKAAAENPELPSDMSEQVILDEEAQSAETSVVETGENSHDDLAKRAALGAAAGGLLVALLSRIKLKKKEKVKMTGSEIETVTNHDEELARGLIEQSITLEEIENMKGDK